MSCCGHRQITSSPENPVRLGESTDGTIRRVRSTINYGGLAPGEISWVTGSLVDELIDLKVLVEVT